MSGESPDLNNIPPYDYEFVPLPSKALLAAEHRGYERGRVEREWQPFTTAPEDGSVILAYRPDAGVFTAIHCEADAHLSSVMRPPEGDFSWFTTGGDDLADDMPTHWMPLPAPPAKENANER